MKNFFVNIFNLIRGLLTVFMHAFKKRVTLEYPEKKAKLNDRFRGRVQVDISKCAGCGICQKVCPCFGVIKIEKNTNIEDGKPRVASFTIDAAQCIFCGNCVENCPSGAIFMTKECELATCDKESLKTVAKTEIAEVE